MTNGIRPDHAAYLARLTRIDLEWQDEREGYLDWGREPQPLGVRAVAVVLALFTIGWGLAVNTGAGYIASTLATTTVAVLCSRRFHEFDAAHRAYLARRAAVSGGAV